MVFISDDIKYRMIIMKKVGATVQDISTELNIARSSVYRIVTKFDETNSVKRLAGSGRQKKLSPRNERAICRTAMHDRRMPLSSVTYSINNILANEDNSDQGIQVSKNTVRKVLHEKDVFGRAAAKKLSISPSTRKIRNTWCREKSLEDENYWQKVIFSDESRFGLQSDGRVWVWRRSHERYAPHCTVSQSTDRRSIMYWGCISYDGVGKLIRCTNHVKAEEYCNILQEACIQIASTDCQLIFMQDNAPIHRAQVVTDWLTENSVSCIAWPPYSPDLNPIEEVWSFMKRQLNNINSFKSLDELDRAVQNIWSELSLAYIRKLYDSMQSRLIKCIKNKGYPINY
jgi:transposase